MNTKRFIEYVVLLMGTTLILLFTSCESKSGRLKEQMNTRNLERQLNSRNYNVVLYNPNIYTIENDSIATVRVGTRKVVYKLNQDDNRYYLEE